MRKRKKRIPKSVKSIYSMLILISCILMSVGYAAINAVTLNIFGDGFVNVPEGVLIKQATYLPRTNSLDNENATITTYYNRTLSSTVTLEPNEETSQVTIEVELYNNSQKTYVLNDVSYNPNITGTYDNPNIGYELEEQATYTINPQETLTVYLTFNYTEGADLTSNTLTSLLIFDFIEYVAASYSQPGTYTFTAPQTGTYKLEVWGASGGDTAATNANDQEHVYVYGGNGGYSSGEVSLTAGDILYVVVGGEGKGSTARGQTLEGGYNGGGTVTAHETWNHMNGSGGGATHIAKMTGLLSELYYNQDQVLLVAGGGGGSRNQQNNDVAGARYGNGGAGGGLEGIVATAYGGTGILHTCATCAAGQETTEERFGQGAGSTGQAAGGSGWQGGGSGTQKSDAGSTIGSGSGGSGYIDGIESGNTIPGNQPVPSPTGLETINGKDGDGYAKITLIDSTGSPIGVYINSAKYTARTDSLTNESATINSYYGDTLNSKITLESGIQDSEVSIAVNVYNPTSSTYYLAEPKNNNSTANSNITYTYLTDKESLEPNQNMLVTFTFKYTSTADLTQNVINSIIQLVFVEHDLSFHNLETQLVSTKNSKLNVMIDNNGEDDLTGVVTYNGIAISNSVTIKKGENYKIITADTSSILSTLSADTLYILDFKITSPYGYTYKTIGVFKKETAPVSITKIETYINGTLQSNENNIYNTENTILVDNQQTNTSYQYVITVKNNSLNDSYKFRNITEILNNSSKLTYTLDIDLSDGMIINPQKEYTFTINYNYTSSSSRHIQMLFLDFKWNYKFEATEDKIISLATPETSTETTYGDFVTLDSASKLDSFCTLANCYSDNNGLIEYNEDGGMVLDFNNQILSLEIDQSMSIKNEYSLYMTFKADTNQKGIPAGLFPATAIAVSSADMKYLNWTGFYSNYLNLYSYYNGASKRAIDYALETTGFISVDFSQYSNQKINMLITATRGGKTHVYINGELFVSFDSGADPVDYTSATIGDLRPGRGLKFTGIIYDFALYNKALTEEEVQTNWEYANARWQITN